MRRVVLGGDALADFSYEPGQDLMLALPADGRTVRRRYTIRRVDRDRRTVDIDVLLHGHGPGARWASEARRHDPVAAAGPRGKIGLQTGAAWHLFVGDDAAIPVTLALLEAVAPQQTAIAVLDVEGPEDEQPAARPVTWLHRRGAPAGDPTLVATHLRALALPTGEGAVYLNGERSVMRAAQAVLLERGVDAEAIRLKAYWVRDEPNGDHGEPIPVGGFPGSTRAG
jgi:NADPH-dependent ferric siderophore reductase